MLVGGRREGVENIEKGRGGCKGGQGEVSDILEAFGDQGGCLAVGLSWAQDFYG